MFTLNNLEIIVRNSAPNVLQNYLNEQQRHWIDANNTCYHTRSHSQIQYIFDTNQVPDEQMVKQVMKSFKVCKLQTTTKKTPQKLQSLKLHTETEIETETEFELEEEEEEKDKDNSYALVPYNNHHHSHGTYSLRSDLRSAVRSALRSAVQYFAQRSLRDLTNDGARMVVYTLNTTEILVNYTINYAQNNTEQINTIYKWFRYFVHIQTEHYPKWEMFQHVTSALGYQEIVDFAIQTYNGIGLIVKNMDNWVQDAVNGDSYNMKVVGNYKKMVNFLKQQKRTAQEYAEIALYIYDTFFQGKRIQHTEVENMLRKINSIYDWIVDKERIDMLKEWQPILQKLLVPRFGRAMFGVPRSRRIGHKFIESLQEIADEIIQLLPEEYINQILQQGSNSLRLPPPYQINPYARIPPKLMLQSKL